MTEANSESCNREGQNSERSIEDWLPVCVIEDAASAAAEDILEAALRDLFVLPMMTRARWGCSSKTAW